MTSTAFPVNLGTVLLEPNRWTPEKRPSFRVSDWFDAIRQAGFTGLELWENHAALADDAEQEALTRGPLPIEVFNSYCTFDDAGRPGREAAAAWVRRLRAQSVKFNFGPEAGRTEEYVRNLRDWAALLPPGCRLLCECHGGTILETPAQAAAVLAPVTGQVDVIVHAFSGERETLREWLARFGRSVTHVHVAGIRGKWPMIRLDEMAGEARTRLALLREAGFAGTWTVEFTAGVQHPPEDLRQLLAHAAADLQFLRENR
jgi:sugar phosphate isomerase/epimerase